MTEKTPLERAIEIMGSQKALADAIGTSQQNLNGWIKRGRGRVPPNFCKAVEKATGIPKHELRPDCYDPPESAEQTSGLQPAAG